MLQRTDKMRDGLQLNDANVRNGPFQSFGVHLRNRSVAVKLRAPRILRGTYLRRA